jgi:cobalt-zinc-cadmium efflux system outer membrane protein
VETIAFRLTGSIGFSKGYVVQTRCIVLALVATLWVAGAQAQTLPSGDLKSAVERAWERAVTAHTLEGKRREADGSRAQAASLFAGSPALGVSNRSDRWTSRAGRQETEVSISAPIWLPGQRAARGALADAEAGQADTAIAAQKLSVAGEVRERVWTLAATDAEVALAKQRAETATALEADVARRVKAGDLARADALLAKQEALSAQAALREVETRRTEAAAKLEVLTGLPALPVRYDETILPGGVLEAHPRIIAARAAREHAERRLRLVTSTRRDAPEVGLSYRWDRATSATPNDRTIGVAVRIPLATDARNRPLEAAAQTAIATAVAEERAARDTVQAELRTAQAALANAESLAQLSEQRSAAAGDRADLIQKAFNLGEQSLAELLRAQTGAREAEAALVRDRAALGLARARLNQAQGILP